MQKLAKVLLVDDDSITTYLNSRLLERLAVADQLLVAHNGAQALHTLDQICCESTEPVLVLLDLHMPVMDGVEFLQTYQQRPLSQHCPVVVVVLTTSQSIRDMTRLQALPVAEVVAKPLTSEKVQAILCRHFP